MLTKVKIIDESVAAIAPWFRLHLPSCSPGLNRKQTIYAFFNLYYWNCNEKVTKINKKWLGMAHFLKNNWWKSQLFILINLFVGISKLWMAPTVKCFLLIKKWFIFAWKCRNGDWSSSRAVVSFPNENLLLPFIENFCFYFAPSSLYKLCQIFISWST